MLGDGVIPLSMIDGQWILDTPSLRLYIPTAPTSELADVSGLLNPERIQGKGRPQGAKNKKRERRDPSGFEYVEAELHGLPVKKERQCGICRESGHNRKTCPNKEN